MWEGSGGGEETAAIFIRGSHLIIDRLVTRMCMAVFASCSCAAGKSVCNLLRHYPDIHFRSCFHSCFVPKQNGIAATAIKRKWIFNNWLYLEIFEYIQWLYKMLPVILSDPWKQDMWGRNQWSRARLCLGLDNQGQVHFQAWGFSVRY